MYIKPHIHTNTKKGQTNLTQYHHHKSDLKLTEEKCLLHCLYLLKSTNCCIMWICLCIFFVIFSRKTKHINKSGFIQIQVMLIKAHRHSW